MNSRTEHLIIISVALCNIFTFWCGYNYGSLENRGDLNKGYDLGVKYMEMKAQNENKLFMEHLDSLLDLDAEQKLDRDIIFINKQ